jgi:hypothetical protein
VVGDTTLKRVTLASGKGALGTWRSQVGQRRESEEPAFSDEPEGKREMRGVDASQRLSFLMFRKTFRGKPGSERYSGNPIVGGPAETWTMVELGTHLAYRKSE